MPTVETGLFLAVTIIAGVFTFGAFRAVGNVKGILHIIALSLFMASTVWLVSGYEVSNTEVAETALVNNTDGSLIYVTTNSTNIFIPGGLESNWFGYVFMGLAMLNLILFVKDVWRAD